MIPKVVHLCFGLQPDFGGKPWSLVHYACLRSIVDRIRPDEILFHYQYEPRGPWWDLARPLLSLRPLTAPTEIKGNALLHVAHRADVVRLEKLIEIGGIYLDCDVLAMRSFDALLGHACVIGEEGIGGSIGLCNAVILSAPRSAFLLRWYESYATFRSRGRDDYWNEHSVKRPRQLATDHPDEITVLGHDAFHWPTGLPSDLRLIYASTECVDRPRTLAHHLWESNAWEPYLEGLTLADVADRDSNFHRWVRPLVVDLPRGYGRPDVAAWTELHLRRLWRRLSRSRPGTRLRRHAERLKGVVGARDGAR